MFVDTDDPEQLFFQLKKIPKLSRILGDQQECFIGVHKDEQEFLETLQKEDTNHVVRRSLVDVDGEGQIVKAYGVLKQYQKKIIKQRLRKRYVIIEQELFGEKRDILLGIKLKEDHEI